MREKKSNLLSHHCKPGLNYCEKLLWMLHCRFQKVRETEAVPWLLEGYKYCLTNWRALCLKYIEMPLPYPLEPQHHFIWKVVVSLGGLNSVFLCYILVEMKASTNYWLGIYLCRTIAVLGAHSYTQSTWYVDWRTKRRFSTNKMPRLEEPYERFKSVVWEQFGFPVGFNSNRKGVVDRTGIQQKTSFNISIDSSSVLSSVCCLLQTVFIQFIIQPVPLVKGLIAQQLLICNSHHDHVSVAFVAFQASKQEVKHCECQLTW